MLECRLTVVSRLRIAVIVGSHGVLASYIPNCTVQRAAAARAGCGAVSTDRPPIESIKALIVIAHARRNAGRDKLNLLVARALPRPQPGGGPRADGRRAAPPASSSLRLHFSFP